MQAMVTVDLTARYPPGAPLSALKNLPTLDNCMMKTKNCMFPNLPHLI